MSGTLTRTAAEFLQCSFRGVPFAVIGSGGQSGRNTFVHAYPYRDGVWVEDLGKQARVYRVAGMLVGPLCYAQRDLLVMASEIQGAGLLVHPSVGVIHATLMRFEWRERDGAMNVIDVSFEFIEKSDVLGGLITTSLHAAIGVAAIAMQSSSSSDYGKHTQTSLSRGSSVLSATRAVAENWSGSATQAMQSPRALASAMSVLPGENGRYAAGNSSTIQVDATVDSVIANLTVGRATVASAVAQVSEATDAPTIAAAVYAITEALRTALNDPGAQVSLLQRLAVCDPVVISSSAPIGSAIAIAQIAAAALCRQAALFSIAQACSDWVPTSSEDAEYLRQTVADLLDAEATIAADSGWDATWRAMRDLRTQVTQDLSNRAARLPDIVTVQRNEPMPALALAQQIYADGTRASDLIRRADPVHPAFMPTNFEALSS